MEPQGKGHPWRLGYLGGGLQKVLEGRKQQLNGEQLVADQPWTHRALLLEFIHSNSMTLAFSFSLGCSNKIPQTRWFINNKHGFLTVLKG